MRFGTKGSRFVEEGKGETVWGKGSGFGFRQQKKREGARHGGKARHHRICCGPMALKIDSALPIWSFVDSCCHSLGIAACGSVFREPQYRTMAAASSQTRPPASSTKGRRVAWGTLFGGYRQHFSSTDALAADPSLLALALSRSGSRLSSDVTRVSMYKRQPDRGSRVATSRIARSRTRVLGLMRSRS